MTPLFDKDEGNITSIVVQDLIKNHWIVSPPLPEQQCCCHLVATQGQTIRRIYVKQGSVNKRGVINVNKKHIDVDHVDTIAVTDGTKIAYINITDVKNVKTFTVHFNESKNNKRRRFQEQYSSLM